MNARKTLGQVSNHAYYVARQKPTYTRLFTALYGSQNYGLDTEASDVDTKTLMLPDFNGLCLNKEQLSETLLLPNTDEHAEVKDARKMFDEFKKQNPTTLELLFTPYVSLNPEFAWFYDALYARREDVAHYDCKRLLLALAGCMRRELCKSSDKALARALQFKDFMMRYLYGENFETCLEPSNRDFLAQVKAGDLRDQDKWELRNNADKWLCCFWENTLPQVKDEPNKQTAEFMDDLLMKLFRDAYGVRG